MKKNLLIAACIVVLGAGGATLAWAATSADSSTIDACVAKNGKVSIYASGQSCLSSERKVSWNIQGPAGPQGPPGLVGTIPGAVAGAVTVSGGNTAFTSPFTIIAVSHEIVSPRDAASGLPTGKRQHKPLTITKEIDKATPLLMRAIFTNQTLPVVMMTLNDSTGKAEATIKLTNAQVSDNVQSGDHQTISFTYQKITWTWVDGGITAEDDWETSAG